MRLLLQYSNNREMLWDFGLMLAKAKTACIVPCRLFLCNRKFPSAFSYFFWTYFKQSMVTAARMMMPEKTNWRLVSTPRTVRE